MSATPVKLPNDSTNTGPQMHAEQVSVDGQNLLQQVVQVAGLATTQTATNASLASVDAKTPALDAGAVPVRSKPSPVTPTDRSGLITTGGSAQVLSPANATRRGLWIKNMSTADLWINDIGTAAAAAPSLQLGPGDYWETQANALSAGAISIFGATTGQAFTAREY